MGRPRLGLLLALPLAALSRRTYKVGYQAMNGAAPHYAYDAAQEKYVGAYPDLMDLIAQELDVDTVDVYVGPWWKNPLRRGEADIIFSLGPMTDGFYYTSPIHSMTFHGLLKSTSRSAEYWSLFDPFHWRLWVAICVTVILGTVVAGLIAYLERAWDPREDPLEFGAMLYHSVTLLLGGDDLSGAMATSSGAARLHRLGLLFLALITTSSFTANLAAFLTNPRRVVSGPGTLDELSAATACVSYDWWGFYVTNFAGGVVWPPNGAYELDDYAGRTQFCVDAVKDDASEVDVFLTTDAQFVLLENCDSLVKAPGIEFEPTPVYGITHSYDIMRNVSQAVYRLRSDRPYYDVVNAHYRTYDMCPGAMDTEDSSEQISVRSMESVFLIFFANAAVAIGLALFDARRRRRDAKTEAREAALEAAAARETDAPRNPLRGDSRRLAHMFGNGARLRLSQSRGRGRGASGRTLAPRRSAELALV